jgi:hypothetical protein
VNLNEIRDLDTKVDSIEVEADAAKEDLKSCIDAGCSALRLKKDAYRSARKLKKLDLLKRDAWLRTFDACRAAFGFDDQTNLEDAIEAAQADDDTTVTLSGEGIEPITMTGKRFRKAARDASLN